MEKKPRNPSNIARRNKAIGRDFQKEVRDLIFSHFHSLESDDVRSNPMGAGGEDLLLSPAARKLLLNTQHECKSREKIAMVSWMEQAKAHGKHYPVVWYKETGKGNEVYASVPAKFLLVMMAAINGLTEELTK